MSSDYAHAHGILHSDYDRVPNADEATGTRAMVRRLERVGEDGALSPLSAPTPEFVARLEALAASLESAVTQSTTRVEHIRVSAHARAARSLLLELTSR